MCLAWPLTASFAQQPTASSETDRGGLSLFDRTVIHLQEAPPQEQEGFAVAALAELAAVYMAEADLARSQLGGQTSASRARLRGWAVAVDQYAGQLLLVLEDVEQGFPVLLRPAQQGAVTITVADRAVMLGHPRPDQQAAYEQRVLSDFCNDHECEQLAGTATERQPIPAMGSGRTNTQWNFTESGSICTFDGLEVLFDAIDNLPAMRGICEQLAQETKALAGDLAWQIRHGVAIDWDKLTVSATPGRPEHLVRLNASGDSVLLTAPLLYASGKLLEDITPWLSARARRVSPVPTMRLDAADYGWQ